VTTALTRKQFLHLGVGAAAATLLPGCPAGDDGDTGADSGATSSGTAAGTTSTTATTATTASSAEGSSGDTSPGSSSETGAGGCGSDPDASFTMHVHTLDVTLADVTAGVDKSYVAGGAHTHDVLINASAFATLLAEGKVIVSAAAGGVDGHTHAVTLTCP